MAIERPNLDTQNETNPWEINAAEILAKTEQPPVVGSNRWEMAKNFLSGSLPWITTGVLLCTAETIIIPQLPQPQNLTLWYQTTLAVCGSVAVLRGLENILPENLTRNSS